MPANSDEVKTKVGLKQSEKKYAEMPKCQYKIINTNKKNKLNKRNNSNKQ